ncbi:hypothetical protein BRC93_16200 [Halobacteriales archaeon QS_5_70_15]|nr:MAG: hypothetical protein BRC93_16200 [Halobacteriales archaeon QS_5_70_15]
MIANATRDRRETVTNDRTADPFRPARKAGGRPRPLLGPGASAVGGVPDLGLGPRRPVVLEEVGSQRSAAFPGQTGVVPPAATRNRSRRTPAPR